LMEILKKRPFWFAMGGLLIAALIASWFVTQPVRRDNAVRLSKLSLRRQKLRHYAELGDQIKNEDWIKRERRHKELVDSQVRSIQGFLVRNVPRQSELFHKAGPDSPQITDHALWRDRYVAECRKLLTRLTEAQVKLGTTPIQFRYPEWGATIPGPTQIREAQKEFWILMDLVDRMLDIRDEGKQVPIARLESIKFPVGPEEKERAVDVLDETMPLAPEPAAREAKPRPVIEQTYVPIPVKVVLDIDSRYLLVFIQRLLDSPWAYNIHMVDCTRVPKEERRGPMSMRRKAPTAMSPREQMFRNTAIRVTMLLEALDFSPLAKALAAEKAGSSAGSGGSGG